MESFGFLTKIRFQFDLKHYIEHYNNFIIVKNH